MTAPSTAALVTGCSSGIGRAAALALHDAGFPVWATARRPEALGDLVERGLRTLPLDVTDEDSMRAAVDRVVAEQGAVGVLVNNAGYALQATVEEVAMNDARRQFETNVFGPLRLVQLVLPGMREQGWGRIVNVGSMGGRFTFPGGGCYHASKHALEALTDALRLEVASFGVKVSLIEPGPVQTRFGDAAVETMEQSNAPATAGPYGQFNAELAARYLRAYDERAARSNVSPEAVAAAIVRAAGEHPRSRYAVGAVARFLITTRRLTPDVVWDRLMRRTWPTPG
jgi:NAD(P)-dependent dehydrogenase (short-subunit alcohol dehydrogenase family)